METLIILGVLAVILFVYWLVKILSRPKQAKPWNELLDEKIDEQKKKGK